MGKDKEASMAYAFHLPGERSVGAAGSLIRRSNNSLPRNAAVAAADKLIFPQL